MQASLLITILNQVRVIEVTDVCRNQQKTSRAYPHSYRHILEKMVLGFEIAISQKFLDFFFRKEDLELSKQRDSLESTPWQKRKTGISTNNNK